MATSHNTVPASALTAALKKFRTHLYGELNLQPTTIENYLGVVKRATPSIGLKPSPIEARNYVAELAERGRGYAHLTVTAVGLERYMTCIGKPCKLGRPRKPGHAPIAPLSEFEVGLIIRSAHSLRLKAMFSVLAYSAVRNNELCHLEVRDADIARQMLTVRRGKGDKIREVNLSGQCVSVLADYLRERDASPDARLFISVRHGYPLEPQDIRKIIRRAAKDAGVHRRVWPHLFRHSLACNLVDRGANVFTIQLQLGHERLSTTMNYLHPSAQHAAQQYHACVPRYE